MRKSCCAIALIVFSVASRAGAAEQTSKLEALVKVLASVDDAAVQRDVLAGLHAALRDRQTITMPPGWHEVYEKLSRSGDAKVREEITLLSLLFGDAQAQQTVRNRVADPKVAAAERENGLQSLVQTHDPRLVPLLHGLLSDATMRGPALRALAAYGDQSTPQVILSRYDQFTEAEKRDAVMTLCSRPASAVALLDAIDAGKIPRHDLAAFNVRQILALSDKAAEEKLTKVWGPVRVASADKAAELAKYKATFNLEVMSHANPANGRAVFNRTCAQCHTLFDSGGQVGPNLTGAQRTNMEYVLGKVLDPSAVVSKDYRMTVIKTKDGRVINGIVSQESDNAVTLKAPNETIVVQKGDIEKRKQSDISLMPEGMLAGMTQDEARDLLAYLASPSQVPLPKTAEPPTARAH